jgi:NADH-ubiquinone oxidoreductase chain 6
MFNLYILNEMYTNGLRTEILDVITVLAIICGILVIICKNPILSVLFLIGLFLSIASYLLLLGLNFIGLSYILVYVGAVSILFLFILMLLNVRISELLGNTSNSIPLAIFITISFYYPIYPILPYSISSVNSYIINLIGNSLSDILNNNNYVGVKLNDSLLNTDKLSFVSSNV